jgi:hypothetical protein
MTLKALLLEMVQNPLKQDGKTIMAKGIKKILGADIMLMLK